MSAVEPVSLTALSDHDALSLLFDLGGDGQDAREKLVQLDAVVYERLLRTYEAEVRTAPGPRPGGLPDRPKAS